jgi:transketolase
MNQLDSRSKYLRRLMLLGLAGAQKGHLGSAFSAQEIIRVLYDSVLKYNSKNPEWPERDFFILSKGHGCLAHYSILADKGFISVDELKDYASVNSRLAGCSESLVPGIETTTGALGHGLSVGVGLALGSKMLGHRNRTYVVLGDGELNEGSIWEALMCAQKYKLENLYIIIDANGLQIGGSTKFVMDLAPLAEKFRSFGYSVTEVDGHNIEELEKVFKENGTPGQLTVTICHTVKGKGYPPAENDYKWHWKSGINAALVADIEKYLE